MKGRKRPDRTIGRDVTFVVAEAPWIDYIRIVTTGDEFANGAVTIHEKYADCTEQSWTVHHDQRLCTDVCRADQLIDGRPGKNPHADLPVLKKTIIAVESAPWITDIILIINGDKHGEKGQIRAQVKLGARLASEWVNHYDETLCTDDCLCVSDLPDLIKEPKWPVKKS